MTPKITRFFTVAAGLCAFVATARSQTTVSTQFSAFNDKTISASGPTAGAFPEPGSTFNIVSSPAGNSADGSAMLTFTASGLIASTGATTGVGFNLTYTGTYQTNTSNGQDGVVGPMTNSNNNNLLSSSFFNRHGSQATPPFLALSLNITGLNLADSYNLYVYVESAGFSGGDTATIMDGTQSFTFSTNSNASSLIAGVNYVEFTGLTGTSTTVTIPGDTVAGVTGFQLVDLGAPAGVPEPSTICLLGLGLVGGRMMVRRKLASA